MSKIKPFKGIIYNQEKIADLAQVICPPYDIISPEYRELLSRRHIYNFIHILLGKDIPGEDKYQRSAGLFREWLKDGTLVQDRDPAVYFYSQQYFTRGEKRMRLGFIALLRLPDAGQDVFGHEHTRLEAKEDRFRLLKSVKANLSPIFSVFLDKKRIIQRIYQHQTNKAIPFIAVSDDEKVKHQLWRITAPDVLESILVALENENIFIADGHHRFEVACAYKEKMKQKLGSNFTGEESFNYLLSYFTNTDPRGLLIMPIHRLLKLKDNLDSVSFKVKLEEYFEVEEFIPTLQNRGLQAEDGVPTLRSGQVPALRSGQVGRDSAPKGQGTREPRASARGGSIDQARFFFLLEKGGQQEHLLGLYKDRQFWLLRLKNVKILDKILQDKPKEYRRLDVCILNYIILNKILAVSPDDKDSLEFNPNPAELIKRVNQGSNCLAFFLNPVRMEEIIAVALSGNKMPAKSTYFYPKVASGLVINKLE